MYNTCSLLIDKYAFLSGAKCFALKMYSALVNWQFLCCCCKELCGHFVCSHVNSANIVSCLLNSQVCCVSNKNSSYTVLYVRTMTIICWHQNNTISSRETIGHSKMQRLELLSRVMVVTLKVGFLLVCHNMFLNMLSFPHMCLIIMYKWSIFTYIHHHNR